eukprot:4624393-Pleurochrysis_carterae.AAC.2
MEFTGSRTILVSGVCALEGCTRSCCRSGCALGKCDALRTHCAWNMRRRSHSTTSAPSSSWPLFARVAWLHAAGGRH